MVSEQPIDSFQFTGRTSGGSDVERKKQRGSDHYDTIESHGKSDRTEETALPGDDFPESDGHYANTTESNGLGGEHGEHDQAVSPESGEQFNY